MFTGIVSARGSVAGVQRDEERLRISIAAPYADLALGESVAVNGACLTVVERSDARFDVEAITTTRERTTLGDLRVGDAVNLERALAVGDRLGGHFVQGHVDGVGEVVRVVDRDDARLVDVRVPAEVAAVTVRRGSIAIDGVSLTVNAIPEPGVVQVALIPYTRAHTTLGERAPGDRVQIEADMLAKLVREMIAVHREADG